MSRPSCVVNIADVPGEKRPRFTSTPGVGAMIRSLGDAVGLERMGVHVRTIEPGNAGTNRHFHFVEEEWTYVLSGRGRVRIGPFDMQVSEGHFAGFPPGPRPHHFIADAGVPLVLLEGGERRPSEDSGWYPDAGKKWLHGNFIETDEPPPAEEGDRAQLVHADDAEIVEIRHDLDREVERRQCALHRPTGLERQAVYKVHVAAGGRTTVLHTHAKTEEWVLILSGRAIARSGDATFEIGPDDFLGYPANCEPHVIQAVGELSYLMGGQIDASDIVTYPEAGFRRVAGRLEPFGTDR